MAFTYDLFLSYASQDRAWAERLYNDLLARNRALRIFWDRASIPAAVNWRNALDEALDGSQHFVSIWSEAAKASNEVGPEIEHFKQRRNLSPRGPQVDFYIPLEGSRGPEELQGFPDLRTLGVYKRDAGPEDVAKVLTERKAGAAWTRIVTLMLKRMDDVEPGDPFGVIVMTMTREQALKLTPASEGAALPPLGKVLKRFNFTVDELQDRYGPTVWDWKPFGQESVADLLDELQVEVNRCVAPPIRWKKDAVLFDRQLSIPSKLQSLNDTYGKKPSLLVLDPFALYDDLVRDSYRYLDEPLLNRLLVVVSLSPDGGTKHPLWEYLRDGGYPYLKAFYDPPAYEGKTPLFGLNLRQVEEIQRLVRLSVNKRVSPSVQMALNLLQP